MLTDSLGNLFKELDFEAVRGETESGYKIFASDSPIFKMDGYICVTIEGKSQDFVVELELNKDERKRSFFSSAFLSAMLGGGYFLSKRLKSEEAWIKFQREFWKYVENAVQHLTNSADSLSG